MTKYIQKLSATMVMLPMLTTSTTLYTSLLAGTNQLSILSGSETSSVLVDNTITDEEQAQIDLDASRAKIIDDYMAARSMPLAGKGAKFIEESNKYDMDWRLLPAIAMRETSGGKNACYNNPFGWGSCKIKFASFDEAIETVARNLGGANPKTAMYYKDQPTMKKLYYYNGTVVASYPAEVVKIMNKISKE